MIDKIIRPYAGENEEAFMKRKTYFDRLLKGRFEWSEQQLMDLTQRGLPLDADERKQIDEVWAQYLPVALRDQIIQYGYYEFYKTIKSPDVELSRYIPDAFTKTFIDDYFTNPQHSMPCDDKNLYDLYFHDVNRPKTLFRKVKGLYLDNDYSIITQEKALAMANELGEVICKVAKFSMGGSGVMVWNASQDDESKLINFLNGHDYVVCQEMLKQHKVLSRLNPTCVNTLRIMTLLFNDDVHVFASMMRMGPQNSRIDNASSGGVVCGILPSGQLKDVGWNGAGDRFDIHPLGFNFSEITIPNYSRCVDLVKTLASRFSSISRMIGWDLAIDEAGSPALIEFNVTFSGTGTVQMTNGPLFGDLTDDVLKEVFANSYTLKSIIKSFQ